MRATIVGLAAVMCLHTHTVTAGQQRCGPIHECAQAAVDAAQAAQRSAQNAIPAGAIMPFRLRDCPFGWVAATDLAGRVIVGAGEGGRDQNTNPLTERKLGQTGGEEAHKLIIPEMPSRSLTADIAPSDGRADVLFGATRSGVGNGGLNQPHNTMPPFLVLTYCEKK